MNKDILIIISLSISVIFFSCTKNNSKVFYQKRNNLNLIIKNVELQAGHIEGKMLLLFTKSSCSVCLNYVLQSLKSSNKLTLKNTVILFNKNDKFIERKIKYELKGININCLQTEIDIHNSALLLIDSDNKIIYQTIITPQKLTVLHQLFKIINLCASFERQS